MKNCRLFHTAARSQRRAFSKLIKSPMEYSGEPLASISPFLPPLIIRSSTVIYWPPLVSESIKSLAKGPDYSNVNSGQSLALAVADIRNSLGLPSLHPSVSLGFSLFFDDLMNMDEAEKWFKEVIPRLSGLLLRLPELLQAHYKNDSPFKGIESGLRLLEPQQSGIVIASQELIASLLVCSLFCLFPTTNRGAKHLPPINFDTLFIYLHEYYDIKLENKLISIAHYFERICADMPMGNVSFERKVLPLRHNSSNVVYPEADFWSKSTKSLCKLEVHPSGLIEDQPSEALEVDFANKYMGGGALSRGCVQEEIRFMMFPEYIISMFFFPVMSDNEAIQIIGAERFSNYTGYASSFRWSSDYVDKKALDSLGRRKTIMTAIDALYNPGKKQYRPDYLLRETNKAFCGFIDQIESELNVNNGVEIGVATGNWGCGAFGGDPEIKAVMQWIAASEAQRGFILYYTFGLRELENFEVVGEWILSHKWSVGELWDMLVEYSGQRVKGEISCGFFNWLLPSLSIEDPMMLDVADNE